MCLLTTFPGKNSPPMVGRADISISPSVPGETVRLHPCSEPFNLSSLNFHIHTGPIRVNVDVPLRGATSQHLLNVVVWLFFKDHPAPKPETASLLLGLGPSPELPRVVTQFWEGQQWELLGVSGWCPFVPVLVSEIIPGVYRSVPVIPSKPSSISLIA